jgi:hypothetical protein
MMTTQSKYRDAPMNAQGWRSVQVCVNSRFAVPIGAYNMVLPEVFGLQCKNERSYDQISVCKRLEE